MLNELQGAEGQGLPPLRFAAYGKVMRIARLSLAVFVLATLSGCGGKDTDPGPGGVTKGEARTLDEAAEMLDARQLPPRQPVEDAQASQSPPDVSASEPVN